MRKALTLFIILFLFGNNVVWALDAMDIGQEHEKQSHRFGSANETQNQETDSCDHCCHVSAHFLGILFDDTISVTYLDSLSTTSNIHSHVSWIYQPPLPPPNT